VEQEARMTTEHKRILDLVDVSTSKSWNAGAIFALILDRFPYLIDVSEHETMEWDDARDCFAPAFGGWFLNVVRRPDPDGAHFPNDWERDNLALQDHVRRGFAYGDLLPMLETANAIKHELGFNGFPSLIVFRPGSYWLPRRERSAAHSNGSRGAA
jgi:hypothetical protein